MTALRPTAGGSRFRSDPRTPLRVFGAVVVAALVVGPGTAPAAGGDGTWLGPDGTRLPFANDEEVVAFLRTAPIVAKKELTSGTTRPWKLTLEADGVRAHAVFRTVDVDRRIPGKTGPPALSTIRDRYVYELAAYEVARLLELDVVPPVTLREVDGRRGSIQLWVENAASEADRLREGRTPADAAGLSRQKSATMEPFDALVYNFDRNHGNMLVDAAGKLWLIDHTRSFKALPDLPDADRPTIVDRRLWEALRKLDKATLLPRLSPYLTPVEIDALWRRRALLLTRLEHRIAKDGEKGVLVDARPAAG